MQPRPTPRSPQRRPTSSLSADSLRSADSHAADAFNGTPYFASQEQHRTLGTPAPSRNKGLAIAVPSFSAFRSQLPAIQSQQREGLPYHHLLAASPRAASFSVAQKASPRLAEPAARPLSLGQSRPPYGLLLYDRSSSPYLQHHGHERSNSIDSRIASSDSSSAYSSPPRTSIQLDPYRAHEQHTFRPSSTSSIDPSEHSAHMIAVQRAPVIHTEDNLGPVQRIHSDESLSAASNSSANPPKSPVTRLGSFFGWKTPQKSEGDSSSTTTFSEQSTSPLPSPRMGKTLTVDKMESRQASAARLTPPMLDMTKANGTIGYFENPQTPLLIGQGASSAHVAELERELSHISQELAGSIRREMELEDELDRIRAELPMTASDTNLRRTSDYFSDSGASSTRFPITDFDAKLEQLEKQLRKVEQEKANMKIETASRLQTELGRRRDLEQLVQNLEDQVERHNQEGVVRGNDKIGDLERRLGQEKMTKESIEDLYSATREELEMLKNDADNLRNEVVPQLKARVEGLEAEAADNQALTYDNARLQQEIAAMRGGNHSRFGSITEDGVMNSARMSLTRSGSLARASSLRRGAAQKDGGRPRAGSAGGINADGLKEIEDQRDALHKALKLLIRRYEKQQREHERSVRKLSGSKDKLEHFTPKRSFYTREVAFLKEEVTTLRKRTEDALEQKWQYEKNLSGLKMDLDRAEQETRGLRNILQENDAAGSGKTNTKELNLSISKAEKDRDHARKIAADYRKRAQSAGGNISSGLLKSAKRMEELAEQLEGQVKANTQLRERLTVAVSKGEREQKESTRQIEDMQRRLAGMEDSVLAAQQHSETTLANHDAEVRKIEDASSPNLQRLDVPEPNKLAPPSPLLKKSPKLSSKKLSETSLLEMSRTQMLERKVKELESLLREAEEDVQTVVQRVNKSQMEVADLQTERDAALIQMRKLQDLVVQETEKAEPLMH